MHGAPELRELDAWRLLLNVAYGYEGMSFGDGGALAIVASAADLAQAVTSGSSPSRRWADSRP